MKEYQHKNVTIRIHDANIEPAQRRKELEHATIKFMKEVMKNDKIVRPSSEGVGRNA